MERVSICKEIGKFCYLWLMIVDYRWAQVRGAQIGKIELPNKIWTMMNCCMDTVTHPVPLKL